MKRKVSSLVFLLTALGQRHHAGVRTSAPLGVVAYAPRRQKSGLSRRRQIWTARVAPKCLNSWANASRKLTQRRECVRREARHWIRSCHEMMLNRAWQTPRI